MQRRGFRRVSFFTHPVLNRKKHRPALKPRNNTLLLPYDFIQKLHTN
jgi:hypothetical protein